jgi:hypothetical protein
MFWCGVNEKIMKSQFGKCENGIISLAHKRTEGRAPLWGSEFTTKIAALQGKSAYFAAGIKPNL